MSQNQIGLRPYRPDDETAAIALWHRSWRQAYPDIDFAARLDWWRERWRAELVANAQVVVAEAQGEIVGFVTIDPHTGYLDQIVVAPEAWGGGAAEALLARAKALSPQRVDLLVNKDNHRAIGFYMKHDFVIAGEDLNPTSGRPVLKMSWRPE